MSESEHVQRDIAAIGTEMEQIESMQRLIVASNEDVKEPVRSARNRKRESMIHMSDDISDKLDILIKLQAAALTAPMESSKDKIVFLSNAGLRPTLIAEILGTTTNHVNVALSKERKPMKGR